MKIDRPPHQNIVRLNCERLEDRTTPTTTYAVKVLSSPQGFPGNTAATVTGTIGTNSVMLIDANGATLVSANSPLEAVQNALAGQVVVTFDGNTYTYTASPGSIGGAATDHKPFLYYGQQLWLEDLAEAGNSDWDYNDHKWFIEVAEHIPTTDSGLGDLDIIDSTGAAVTEAKETAVGGWVPLNNDNDNYNFPSATSLAHIEDRTEMTQVAGEDDLVPIQVTLPANATGWWLTFDELAIRVWKSADKNGKYTSGSPRNASESTTLWVEGTSPDYYPRQHLITLYTRTGYYNQHLADQVKVTVYQVNGAMNVPGYSRHTYEATVPDNTPRFAAGNAALGVTPANPVANSNTPTTSRKAEVYWDAGAVVGTYKVYPTADDNFYVTRQVNVVKVEFSAQAAGDNQLIYENNERAPKQDPSELRKIHSSLTHDPPPPGSPPGTPPVKKAEPAMRAFLKISRIEGPTVGGVVRGVRFIEAGLVQNLTVTAKHGVYTGFAQPRNRVSSLEGQSYLDALTETSPWYLPSSHLPQLQPATYLGVYAHGTDPAAPLTNVATLKISDSPEQLATDKMKLTVGVQDDDVDEFQLRVDFKLYFAVRTLEDALGSEKIYSQRGLADWHFDGSAGVIAWVWQKGAANNGGAGSFGEVTNGSVVPLTDPTKTANKASQTATWSTV